MPKFLRGLRRSLYKGARSLGDLDALLSLNPERIVKRGANKLLGRKVARRFFFR